MIYEGETPEVTIYHDIKVSLSFDAVEMSSLHHSYRDSSMLYDSQHEFDKNIYKTFNCDSYLTTFQSI